MNFLIFYEKHYSKYKYKWIKIKMSKKHKQRSSGDLLYNTMPVVTILYRILKKLRVDLIVSVFIAQ